MARLKVFTAQIGFFESVVAAPSKAAALKAWGVHQDLFAEDRARRTDDPEAVAAATARPGVVLRRPAGGGAFEDAETAPERLPEVPTIARPAPTAKPARAKPEPAPEPSAEKPPPDRSALTAAEKALAERTARYERERADLDRRAAELQSERTRLDRDRDADMRRLTDRLQRAREAFDAQG